MSFEDAAIIQFHPGRIVATATVDAFLQQHDEHEVDLAPLLTRHLTGDWGDIDSHDAGVNDQQLQAGVGRVMSVYTLGPDNVTIWLITDFAEEGVMSDQNITTFLFPSDY